MIFDTAYDTAACSNYKMRDTLHALQGLTSAHTVSIGSRRSGEPAEVRLLTASDHINGTIHYFGHPIAVADGDQLVMWLDARSLSISDHQGFRFTNKDGARLQLLRAALTYQWLKEPGSDVFQNNQVLLATMADMVSQAITRRYALEPGEQLRISVYTAYWYQLLCTDEDDEITDAMHARFSTAAARVSSVSVKDVLKVMEGHIPRGNLNSFCTGLRDCLGNVRLTQFGETILMQLMASGWIGDNAPQLMAVALEHPPTWLAMCYQALSIAGFERSTVGRTLERHTKGDAGQRLKTMVDLMADPKIIEETVSMQR